MSESGGFSTALKNSTIRFTILKEPQRLTGYCVTVKVNQFFVIGKFTYKKVWEEPGPQVGVTIP